MYQHGGATVYYVNKHGCFYNLVIYLQNVMNEKIKRLVLVSSFPFNHDSIFVLFPF